MVLDGRDTLCQYLPHDGAMCLIDSVAEVDLEHIVCLSMSHTDVDNPLRFEGRVPAVCGFEYVGQATYLHGALTIKERAAMEDIPDKPPLAMVASLRSFKLHCDRLDAFKGKLSIEAQIIAFNMNATSYEFTVSSAGQLIMSGRLTSKIFWNGNNKEQMG